MAVVMGLVINQAMVQVVGRHQVVLREEIILKESVAIIVLMGNSADMVDMVIIKNHVGWNMGKKTLYVNKT